MEIEIVRLQVSEWEALKTIRLQALRSDPQAFGSSYEREIRYSDSKWQKKLADELLVFAKLGKDIVGMVGIYQTDIDVETKNAVGVALFILPEYRGLGIATKLMQGMMSILKVQGLQSVSLSVNADQSAAVTLYKRYGFQVVGEDDAQLGDGKIHHELIMKKYL